MIMKAATNTCKNEKFIRELKKEEGLKVIETIIVSLKTLFTIHWKYSLSQWELLLMG